jgi:phosphoglycolate phosphatase
LRREAAALDWERYFARLVGAQDAAADKPDRAAVDLALAGSGTATGR